VRVVPVDRTLIDEVIEVHAGSEHLLVLLVPILGRGNPLDIAQPRVLAHLALRDWHPEGEALFEFVGTEIFVVDRLGHGSPGTHAKKHPGGASGPVMGT